MEYLVARLRRSWRGLASAAAAALSLAGGCVPAAAAVPLPAAELKRLNQAMDSAAVYEDMKSARIDSLKRELRRQTDAAARVDVSLGISDIYLTVNADSALKYSAAALGMSVEHEQRQRSRIASVRSMSLAGLFPKALAMYDSVMAVPMDRARRVEALKAGRQLYSLMLSYISPGIPAYDEYRRKYIACDDSLLVCLPAGDMFRQFIAGERMVAAGDYVQAQKTLEYLLDRLPDDSNLYGMTAYQLAEVHRLRGDGGLYGAFLARAAASDIRGSVKEGLALPMLANWLYEQGELSEAFRYINFALGDAMDGSSRMRTVSIAALVPIIDEAYRDKISSANTRLIVFVVLLGILFVLAAGLLVVLLRRNRHSRAIQRKLEATSKVQESYIGHFIDMCSSYADRLDNLSRMVVRKIDAGQSADLLKIVRSGRYGDVQDENFYKAFDTAFLDMFPDFVFQVNRLLREEEQIEVPRGHGLPPELRIYAFVRLGVDESTRIARILHYSVSTVYTYRNRMRNRALSRSTFDADVRSIHRR